MLTKLDLSKIVAQNKNVAIREVTEVIDEIAKVIIQKVSLGESVNIKNFGTFISKKRAERRGINPRTQQAIIIEACHVPRFKPGKAFKNAVKQN